MFLCSSKGARIATAATALLLFLVWSVRYSTTTWTMPFKSSLQAPFAKSGTAHDSKPLINIPPLPLIKSGQAHHLDHDKSTPSHQTLAHADVSAPEEDGENDGGQGEGKSLVAAASSATPMPESGSAPVATSLSTSNETLQTGEQVDPATASNSDVVDEDNGLLPLILFAYYETPSARRNLEFFLRHGLHAHADFLFVFNGETDAESLLPLGGRPNVRYIKRLNQCYDLGAYGEVLNANDQALVKRYSRFVLLNASLRGPFVPFWSRECWSDVYLAKVTDRVKLVGMTINCVPTRHVQSMLLATDRVGISILLAGEHDGGGESGGLSACPTDMTHAIGVETHLTDLIKARGYSVAVMMAQAWSAPDYVDHCQNSDILFPGAYGSNRGGGGEAGTNVHAYETLFVKTERRTDPSSLELLTQWHDASNYSSYDVC